MTSKEIERVTVIKEMAAKKCTAAEVGRILGISSRQAKRLLRLFRMSGEMGLVSNRRGAGNAHSELTKQTTLSLLRSEQYKGFGPTFASEKLQEYADIQVNRETVRQWMIEAGLWSGKRRHKLMLHQSRLRRPRFGELIQIDGSPHDWFEGRSPKCCLLVFIDDATSRIMHLRFERAETTMGYFRCVKEYVLQHGCPLAFYSDRYGVFAVNKGNADGKATGETQFQRAMRTLDIDMILANSPQAKGRVERANQTLQDRLIKEMRLCDISTMEQANVWLLKFIQAHNDKFAVEAANPSNAHRDLEVSTEQLDLALSIQETRKLSKNLETQYRGLIYQIVRPGTGYSFRHAAVMVREHMDGSVAIYKGNQLLQHKIIDKTLSAAEVVDKKALNVELDKRIVARALRRLEQAKALASDPDTSTNKRAAQLPNAA